MVPGTLRVSDLVNRLISVRHVMSVYPGLSHHIATEYQMGIHNSSGSVAKACAEKMVILWFPLGT